MLYLENVIAQKYGMPPSQFRALSKEDKAEMAALVQDSETMAGYENYLANKRIGKKNQK